MKEKNEGITLIALVITIIVLLILAGVSIATLTGENGILAQAESAKTETKKAELKERVKLEMLASIDKKGKYDVELAKKNLEDNLKLVKNAENNGYTEDEDKRLTLKYNGYDIYVDEKGNVSFEKHKLIFKPERLTIGTVVSETTSKYGWKVKDYTVEIDEVRCWRLYYQDSNYTYLISDKCIGPYKASDYYNTETNENGELKYKTGADVSIVGRNLNSMLIDAELFTEQNVSNGIKHTAWITDTSDDGMWAKYKNDDAVFAIGSPTLELLAASWNNSGKETEVVLSVVDYGYNYQAGSIFDRDYNKGIYNKYDSEDGGVQHYSIASPHGLSAHAIWMHGGGVYLNHSVPDSKDIRPVVCIPTSVFNENYADSLVDE